MLKKILSSENFTINEKKVHFMTPKSRKMITGIVINGKNPSVPKETKHLVRAMIHKCITTGDYSDISQIRGYISYISSIESDYFEKTRKYILGLVNRIAIFDTKLVTAYNHNKIMKGLLNIKYSKMHKDPF